MFFVQYLVNNAGKKEIVFPSDVSDYAITVLHLHTLIPGYVTLVDKSQNCPQNYKYQRKC